MFIYYCLILIPILFYVIFFQNKNRDKIVISLFFILLLFALCCRSENVGVDIKNYLYIFKTYSNLNWIEIFQSDEFGYAILNKLVAIAFHDFRWLLILCALLSVIPIWIVYIKDSDRSILSIILFVNMSTFVMLFSGLRQSIAIGIGMLAYLAVKNKQPIKFLIFVALASTFHVSAFVLLILYPIYHLKITKKNLILIFSVAIVVLIFNREIFTLLLRFLPEKYIDRYGETSSTGAYTMIILFALFTVFAFVVGMEKDNKEYVGMRNILVLALFIQLFAPIHSVAMRFNYYFINFIPLIVSKSISCSEKRWKNISTIAMGVMLCFFTMYFFYNAYNGADILQVFPYVPFWEG